MMTALIIFALTSVAVSAASVSNDYPYMDEWRIFKMHYGRIYENEKEEEFRMQIYLNASRDINEHNKLYAEGKVSYRLKVNQYSDLLQEEFEKVMGMNQDTDISYNRYICKRQRFDTSVEIPEELDWREDGTVTPVKDQGNHGFCWAFSAAGALESHHFRKTGELVRLSEQNLIDCIKRAGEEGHTNVAFRFVVDQGGIASEESYPYANKQNKVCLYNKTNAVESITGCKRVSEDNEIQLKYALHEVGPISVSFYHKTTAFRSYDGGVIYTEECSSARYVTHAVLLVGYGTDSRTGLDYWLGKNSWGEKWGADGYFKIARNKNSHCLIASMPNYPVG